MNISIA